MRTLFIASAVAVLLAIIRDRPQPLQALKPNLPVGLASLINRLLAQKPEDRPQTADDVQAQLQTIRRELPQPRSQESGVRTQASGFATDS